jgi:eukaryotic-like serine/threonine-protein kinase
VITLTLLHPVQSTPVQSWTFEDEPVIRIGRAVDNQVVLYSAVVSRHHIELRRSGPVWEVVNLGTNGTYLDGKRVHQSPLSDGGTLRLGRSGPNLQVRVGMADSVTSAVEAATLPESLDLIASKTTEVGEGAVADHKSETHPGLNDDSR